MLKIRIAVVAACAALSLPAVTVLAQSASAPMGASSSMGMASSKASSNGMSSAGAADKNFVVNAAVGGMTEIAVSKIALAKGSTQGAKDYAQKMVTDHTKANDELKSIAMPKGMTPPAMPDTMHQGVIDKFDKMAAGPAFDKAYQKQMLADHKKTVVLFQKEAKSGKDADLKGFAGKTLPDLQGHLKMAQTMASM